MRGMSGRVCDNPACKEYRSSLHCSGRNSSCWCRRRGSCSSGILFSLHVHVVRGLHTGGSPAHRGILCVFPCWVCVRSQEPLLCVSPGDYMRRNLMGCVILCIPRDIWAPRLKLKKVAPGELSCGGCAISCGCVILSYTAVRSTNGVLVLEYHRFN